MSDILPDGVWHNDFPIHGDHRGGLIVGETGENVPFPIARVYCIFHSNADVVRGCHAHPGMRQLILNITGSFDLSLDDGEVRKTIRMEKPGQGILITANIWRELSNFSSDSVITCFADQFYKDCIYITDYDEFLAAKKGASE